jgi:hypothetical protein
MLELTIKNYEFGNLSLDNYTKHEIINNITFESSFVRIYKYLYSNNKFIINLSNLTLKEIDFNSNTTLYYVCLLDENNIDDLNTIIFLKLLNDFASEITDHKINIVPFISKTDGKNDIYTVLFRVSPKTKINTNYNPYNFKANIDAEVYIVQTEEYDTLVICSAINVDII